MYLLFFFLTVFMNFSMAEKNKVDWEKTETVWIFDILTSCDVGLKISPVKFFQRDEFYFDKKEYQNIRSGDVVWVACALLPRFYREVLPQVEKPFVLVIGNGDGSFPSDSGLGSEIEPFINHPRIIHIFAQNNDYEGHSCKISHLPIGIDFHTVAYKNPKGGWGIKGSPKNQEMFLFDLIRKLKPTHQRKLRAFVDFQLSDTMRTGNFARHLQFGEDRNSIFRQIVQTGLIDYGGRMKRESLWKVKGQYAFSVSPMGNGLDCHRTWEDLALGCIIIVKTSPLDPLYKGLPVVIIKDWNEIHLDNLLLWIQQYGDALTNSCYREKLTNRYWFNKILEKAQPYRK